MSFYTVLRGLVAIFGFTLLLGVIWFAGSPGGGALVVPSLLMGFSSLVAAFMPQPKLSGGKIARRILVIVFVIGIGAGFVLVVNDIGASGGIEWDVVAINIAHIATLATMAIMCTSSNLI